MKKFLLLIFISTFQLSISQETNLVEISINASVLDYDSKKGISFSEVKFIDKNVGVLTDTEGNFSLNFLDQNINDDDVFSITAYGYDTIKTTADKLYKFLNNTNRFFLKKLDNSEQWFDEDDANDHDENSGSEDVDRSSLTPNIYMLSGLAGQPDASAPWRFTLIGSPSDAPMGWELSLIHI